MRPTTGEFRSGGVRIEVVDLPSAVARVTELSVDGLGHGVHLCNSHNLALAISDKDYRDVLNRGKLNLADGAPVALFARLEGFSTAGPVRGADLLRATVGHPLNNGKRHLFFGGREDARQAILDQLTLLAPNVASFVVSPPFGPVDTQMMSSLNEAVRMYRPDLIWVGLGTPKQDLLIDRYLAEGGTGTLVAVGAVFDFLDGSRSEAPNWLRSRGFEWVFRLWQEPRRLWRRYLLDSPRYLISSVGQVALKRGKRSDVRKYQLGRRKRF